MSIRGDRGKNFIERLNAFLNSEVPDYPLADGCIWYCDTCGRLIPKSTYDANKGTCDKCL